MTDLDQARIAPRDPMLTRTGLAESGRLYAGNLDTTDPLVSPLYGRLDGLAPLTVFCGTHDLLLTDSRTLAHKAAAVGVPGRLPRSRGPAPRLPAHAHSRRPRGPRPHHQRLPTPRPRHTDVPLTSHHERSCPDHHSHD